MATNIKHIESKKFQKALTLEDRVTLSNIITNNRNRDGSLTISLNDIANMLEKDPTTLSKEIKYRRTPINDRTPNYKSITYYCRICEYHGHCELQGKFKSKDAKCENFKMFICKNLIKFPWVCNGCHKKGFCDSPKSYYNPIPAHDSYRYTLVDSREGIYMTTKEFENINRIISNGLKKKQSIEHIIHSNDLPICTKTAYTYLHKGYFDADLLDTHRMVRLKNSSGYKPENSKLLRKAKLGKHYEDFINYLAENPNTIYTQMDTIEGRKGGKVCLSLKVVNVQLQFYFLLENKKASTIVKQINKIQSIIGIEAFKKIFGTILTDNGSEFTDIDGITFDPETGEIRTNIFFCHPQCSGEKGSCEKSHEYFRYILPKGTSFDSLTQEDFDKITSHVNSAKRKSTDYSTPIELFCAHFGKEILDKLNIFLINPNDVILSRELLK